MELEHTEVPLWKATLSIEVPGAGGWGWDGGWGWEMGGAPGCAAGQAQQWQIRVILCKRKWLTGNAAQGEQTLQAAGAPSCYYNWNY